MEKQLNVLFIAKNIPRPGKKTNKIIYKIADYLSEFCTVSFLRPREIIPIWLRNNPKFSDLYKLKGWKYKKYNITTYPYVHLPFKRAKFFLLYPLSSTARQFIKNTVNFDLIHAHYLLPDGYIALKISEKYGIPYILNVRNQDIQYIETISKLNPDYQKATKILRNAKSILVTNLGYKKFIEKRFNIKCEIIPHGIEKEVFDVPIPSKENGKVIITTLADTLKTKNVDWVIKAFREYKGPKNIELRVVGDVIQRTEIIQLANNDKRIKFLGRIPRAQVLDILCRSDIFALPSSRETFGLVYLEAAATKNAIIAYKGEGVWGVFENRKEVLFCSNQFQFSEHFSLLIENKNIRHKLQLGSFKRAKKMEWSSISHMYLDIYFKTIKTVTLPNTV